MWNTLLTLTQFREAMAQIKILVSSPVNPVEESGILSIHCQVWNLKSRHEVSILKNSPDGTVERLSLDGTILEGVDERVFLAMRQLPDGSTVYFLSIIDAIQSDAGNYFCKVQNKAGIVSEVAYDNITVNVTYFPPESDPICSPNMAFTAHEGDELVLNCSSSIAYPMVTLTWGQTGKVDTFESASNVIKGNRVYSKLTLYPTRSDDGAIFLCMLESLAFPQLTQTCHVGPLNVIPNGKPNGKPNEKPDSETHGGRIEDMVTHQTVNVMSGPTDVTPRVKPTIIKTASECKKICSTFTYPVFQWVISTMVTGLVAFILLILCVTLICKYNTIQHEGFVLGVNTAEDIYSELEGRRTDNLVYMSLDKQPGRSATHLLQSKELPPGHYDPMPRSTPKY